MAKPAQKPTGTERAARSGPAPAVRFGRGLRAASVRTTKTGAPATWDPEKLTLEIVLASETPCTSYRLTEDGWDYVEVDEVLSMDGIQDVDGLVGAPLLEMHQTWSLRNVLGVIEAARVEGTQLVCTVRLWDREDLADIVDGVGKGILRNFSVGFDYDTTADVVTMRDGQRPLVTVGSWQPCEGSLVTVPADRTAQARSRTSAPPNARNATMAKPTKAARAAADAAETAFEEAHAALIAAGAVLDEARSKAGLPARKKRDEDEVDGDEGERADGDDGDDDEDGEGGDTDAEKARKAADAEKRAAVVAGLRIVAQRRGKDTLQEFDALAAAGATVVDLKDCAMAAVRTRSGNITSTAGGIVQAADKPALRSFAETAVAKRKQR